MTAHRRRFLSRKTVLALSLVLGLFIVTTVAVSARDDQPPVSLAGGDTREANEPKEKERPPPESDHHPTTSSSTSSSTTSEPPTPSLPSTTTTTAPPPSPAPPTTAAPIASEVAPVAESVRQPWRATYLPHGWIGESRTAGQVTDRVAELTRAGFTHQIHNLGALDATGRVLESDYAGLDAWIEHSRSADPTQLIVAWVSGSESVHVDDRAGHDSVSGFLAELVALHDLDGILLDLEPFTADNPSFLALLRTVRSAVPDTWLGVTAPAPANDWSSTFIAQVADTVDGISPMLYDSTMRTAMEYETWASESLTRFSGAIGGSAQLIPSIPAYSSNAFHNPEVENVETAGRAIRAANGVDGVAVYWWWEFGAANRAWWAALRGEL